MVHPDTFNAIGSALQSAQAIYAATTLIVGAVLGVVVKSAWTKQNAKAKLGYDATMAQTHVLETQRAELIDEISALTKTRMEAMEVQMESFEHVITKQNHQLRVFELRVQLLEAENGALKQEGVVRDKKILSQEGRIRVLEKELAAHNIPIPQAT